MRIAVVVDSWKVEIFRRHLSEAGFHYKELPGPVAECCTFKVETNYPSALQKITEAAQLECSLSKEKLS